MADLLLVQIKRCHSLFDNNFYICADFRDFWCATFQVNTNHTGKFTMYRSLTSLSWWRKTANISLKFCVKKNVTATLN